MLLSLYFTGWWTQGKIFECFHVFYVLIITVRQGKKLKHECEKNKNEKPSGNVKKVYDYLRFHNGSEKLIKSSLKTHENDTITRIFSRKFENISSN